MRMGDSEIGEMPDQVSGTKRFRGSLKRASEVKNDTDEKERECITGWYFVPSAFEGQ